MQNSASVSWSRLLSTTIQESTYFSKLSTTSQSSRQTKKKELNYTHLFTKYVQNFSVQFTTSGSKSTYHLLAKCLKERHALLTTFLHNTFHSFQEINVTCKITWNKDSIILLQYHHISAGKYNHKLHSNLCLNSRNKCNYRVINDFITDIT